MNHSPARMLALAAALFGFQAVVAPFVSAAGGDANLGERDAAASPPVCLSVDDFFRDEVWTKVGQRICLNCHRSGGDAAESRLVWIDPSRDNQRPAAEVLRDNHRTFRELALEENADGNSLVTQKVLGKLDHGGGDVLREDSAEFKILSRFVSREQRFEQGWPAEPRPGESAASKPFFDDVVMLAPERLLRRVTLSLAGRLPTDQELSAVHRDGMDALQTVLDDVMTEDAFYDRLREGFNDLFLMVGYNGVPERVMGYRNFGRTRHWYQKIKFEEIEDERERRQAGYKLAREYREAVLAEPYELIKHIVREELPFTELVTADYIMVSPYTARGYGIYEQIKDEFQNPDDYLEFIPAQLPALTRNDGKPDQHSETGRYPHSGLLTTFHWLKRYPTTETNRNRLRARMYFQHFLGIDVMTLAPRVGDAAAASEKYEIPTMQAAECVVCHKTIDPIAGLFQDYYDTSASMDPGPYSPRKEGWFTDMFAPGADGEDLPETQRWRSLQWLGQKTAADPRFAVAMVEHVYYILTGRKVLTPPQDLEDPLIDARLRAYRAQRDEIDHLARRFAADQFNLKTVFKDWVRSPFYRADGLATLVQDDARRAELDDIGLIRLLSPEQLDRKIEAIFAWRWNRFEEDLRTLYGAIDSKEITERLTDPSGAMGAVQRLMSNEVACKNVARDFALPAEQRRLFPGIEPDVVPGSSVESDQAIRNAIVHLHQQILGQHDAPDSQAVDLTFQLFASIVQDAANQPGIAPTESYFCKSAGEEGPRDPDPHYTLRAWRGVVTYLLRQDAFLYE